MDDKKLELWGLIGLGIGGLIAVLIATRSSSGGTVSSGPSDAAVASIESAGAVNQASANTLALGKTQAAVQAVLGLAQASAATTVATAGDNATVQEDQIQSTTSISTANVLAQANEIIQNMVSDQADFAANIAGQTSVANTAATTNAAVTVSSQQAAAQTAAAQAQQAASQTQSNDGFWSSLVGGITAALPFSFSSKTAPLPAGYGPTGATNVAQVPLVSGDNTANLAPGFSDLGEV